MTLVVILVILFLLLLFTWKNGVSPTPTSSKIRAVLFSLLPEVEKGTIIELGSGWGNLAFPLSKKYPHCKVIGYENSPVPFLFSALLNHRSNLKIVRGDFFEKSLADASIVVCYLFPKGMKRLKDKLKKELRSGTQVITHTHPIPGWEPKEIIDVDDLQKSTIYIYLT